MLKRYLAALLLIVSIAFTAPSAQAAAPQFSDAQKAEIQTIIKDYLVSNPDVMKQALEALQTKIQNDEQARQSAAMTENRPKLEATTVAPAAGNANGNVTVVEFFDYRCGYCRTMAPVVEQLLKDDTNVKLVFREFPILGPVSVTAAKAALAAAAQNKYVEFHNALMNSPRPLGTENDIYSIAATVGVDINRLKADMEGAAIQAEIAANFQLAESMGIRGTPAFVIGSQMYPGALDIAALKNAVSQARAGTSPQTTPAHP